MPRRGLSPAEARYIAERQAATLLALSGVERPAVDEEIVTDLPFVTVTRRPGFPTSGMATQTDTGWVIVLRAEEAKVRQRFSLIHEFKHVLDDPFIEWLYPTKNGYSPEDRAERICDYFAVAIVMHIRKAGAQLVSVSENIDETPSGLLLHGIMSSIAEFYSRNLATEIIKGSTQKAKKGGTPYRAPLGYLNTREIVEDREIRVVTLDPERAKLIRLAFTLYATGQYALSDLAAILEERGLRSRKTRRCPAKPLGTNRLSALLRNDYYVGSSTTTAKTYRGRHEPLVSTEVFGLVQEVLASQRQSGERCWRHHSYLRGTLFCRECKGRLFFVRVRGNGGEYDYFVCSGRQKGICKQGSYRVEQVEAAVERHYAKIQLTDRERERVGRLVRANLDKLTEIADTEIARAQRTISRLEGEEDKLLERYYAERVSQGAYDRQHDRITRERVAAHKMIEKLTIDRDRHLRALDIALSMTKDIQAAYVQADPTQRRLFNQAFFERLEVDAVEIVGHTLSDPYAQLLAHDLIEDAFDQPTPATATAETTTPGLPDNAAEEPSERDETEAEEPASESDTRILVGVGAGPQEATNAITGDLSKVAGYHVESMVDAGGRRLNRRARVEALRRALALSDLVSPSDRRSGSV